MLIGICRKQDKNQEAGAVNPETKVKMGLRRFLLVSLAVSLLVVTSSAYGQQATKPAAEADQANLAEVGAKLSNPVSNVWAMFTEFDLTMSDGNLNEGYQKVGSRMIFQPVLPFPLYGRGEKNWKLITRPIIPVVFATPVPKSYNDFNYLGGVGNIQLPTMVTPPTGQLLLAAGPTWMFPSANRSAFGQDQWGVGPAFILGYFTKKYTLGVFPQYTFGIGTPKGNDKSVSSLSALYFFIYNLPNAWQVGFNPTITYDRNAASDANKNIPIGLIAAKTTRFGKTPVKMQVGMEYSVVSQLPFGQRFQVKFNFIPVIPSLVKNPLFGGK